MLGMRNLQAICKFSKISLREREEEEEDAKMLLQDEGREDLTL